MRLVVKMNKVIELDNDKVYLKRDRSGWRVVHPIKNDDGTWNWKNFLIGGSYWNILKIGFVVGIILFIAYSYKHDMNMCANLLECGAKCPEIFYNDPTGYPVLGSGFG